VSLIDEALKRAQETSRREGEKPAARPWTPAPLPDAGLARRRQAARAAWWTVTAIVAIAAGVVALRRPIARAPERESGGERPGIAATPASATAVPAPAAEATRPPAPVRSRPTRPAASAPPPGESQAAANSEEAAPAAAPRALADGRSYVGAVDLPDGGRIELGGIVWSEEDPRALLNDRIVATDAYVAGFTVSKIEENRVVLVRDGMTIYLSLK
jgi:hypothetical protein